MSNPIRHFFLVLQLTKDAAKGFGSFGLVLFGVLGDLELAGRVTRLAKRMLDGTVEMDSTKAKKIVCHVLYVASVFVDSWVIPIHHTLKPLHGRCILSRRREQFGCFLG